MKEKDKRLFELYLDINRHLLNDNMPSKYLQELISDALFQEWPFRLLFQLQETKQSPLFHPEGNVWNHTIMVVDQAANVKSKSRDQRVFMWAALLHDIGKPSTTKVRKGRITSYDHDKAGESLAVRFLQAFTEEEQFICKVSKLVRYHMHILYVVKKLPYGDIKGMLKEVDSNELALLGYCDRVGRKQCDVESEKRTIRQFLKECSLLHSIYNKESE